MGSAAVKAVRVQELVRHLNLAKFHTYELVAAARDEYEVEEDEPDASGSDASSQDEERIKVQSAIRRRRNAVDYRIEFVVNHDSGYLLADIGAFYDCDSSLDLENASGDVLIEFGDRIAVMALYPYLRQAIADLGLRVGVDIMLPVLRRGDLSFAPSAESEEGNP
jgi:hypothetical protein